ncbi:hypothetical protein LXL04_004886 [Taraxacum kok-saghyz]
MSSVAFSYLLLSFSLPDFPVFFLFSIPHPYIEEKKRLEEMFDADLDNLENWNLHQQELPEEGVEEQRKGKGVEKVWSFKSNVMMLGLSPSDYILPSVSKVHTNDLEQTLLTLPFTDALKLLI